MSKSVLIIAHAPSPNTRALAEEAAGRFGDRFIELARAVYVTNDRRAEVKKKINLATGSALIEEKSYKDYSGKG